MINYPKTVEEARRHRYSRWAGNPLGNDYDPAYCAMEVFRERCQFSQCSHRNGHGPANLYCKQHAKKVEGENG